MRGIQLLSICAMLVAMAAYDAVAVLVYSSRDGVVCLDVHMVDTTSGESIWHHQLSTRDRDVHDRLLRHGYWTPSAINRFYGRR